MSNFLTNDFEPYSAAAWKQKIQVDLKGVDYNEALLTQTNEGITIKPFYHLDEFEKLNIPATNDDFKICDNIYITSEKEAKKRAEEIINKGANAIKFIVKNEFNIDELFKNLLEKNIEFHFQFEFISEKFISALASTLKNETVFYNVDIIGNLAKTGNWYSSFNNDFDIVKKLISTKLKF